MNKLNHPPAKLPAYLIFVIIGVMITCAVMLSSPSDPKNAILFGYSLERLLLVAGLIVLTLPLLYLTLKLVRQPQHSQTLWHSLLQSNLLYSTSILSSFFFLILILIPLYRLGGFASYISRLYPILIWLAVVTVVTMLVFIYERKTESLWSIVSDNKTFLRISFIVCIVLFLIALLVIFTGIGVRRPEDYWYGAGVPLLGLQVLASLCIGLVFVWFEKNRGIKDTTWLDAMIGLALFLMTAFLWAREPLLSNYFMPDTAKNVIYPYSDSAIFDVGSQFALIGQGLFNGQFIDRVLYSAFLTYLHVFVGQDVEHVLNVQTVLFSIFPVVIYWLGKELHSRAFGVVVSIVASLRGLNAILVATWIDLAGPKMMTTDFPTAIGVSLFLLFAIKWIKNTSKMYFAVFAGGILGLTLMLRTNVLLLMPVLVVFIILFVSKIRWNYRLLGSLALILGMLTATTPWDLRNRANGYPMFYVYYSRIILILQERYGIQSGAYLPSPMEDESVVQTIKVNAMLNLFQEEGCDTQLCNITNHFFHNLITSFLFLPSSFMFDSLWNTVKEGAPYWQAGWTGGGVTFAQGILIFINLLLVSLGIGLAWEKNKWLGILPLGIFLTYITSNALGMTSAGRYIVPVDWIICFYYILGAFQAVVWMLRLMKIVPKVSEQVEAYSEACREAKDVVGKIKYSQVVWSLGLVFIMGAFIPLSEKLSEKRYEVRELESIFADLEQKNLLEQSGFSQEELLEFLSQTDALFVEGRALYPRYYRTGDGEPDRSTYYRYLDFSRLVFTVIGPYTIDARGVVIAGDRPEFPIHTSDVIVLGCWNTTYYAPFIDAVVVFVISDEGDFVYLRSPEHPLQCPLQEPRE